MCLGVPVSETLHCVKPRLQKLVCWNRLKHVCRNSFEESRYWKLNNLASKCFSGLKFHRCSPRIASKFAFLNLNVFLLKLWMRVNSRWKSPAEPTRSISDTWWNNQVSRFLRKLLRRSHIFANAPPLSQQEVGIDHRVKKGYHGMTEKTA